MILIFCDIQMFSNQHAAGMKSSTCPLKASVKSSWANTMHTMQCNEYNVFSWENSCTFFGAVPKVTCAFLNLLIIHDEITKEITTVEEVFISGLNLH